MPEKVIQKFEINYLQILDENGKCDEKLKPKMPNDKLIEMYKWMVLARIFDNKMFSLQRQGRLGTFAQIKGHEAVQIGAGFALEKDDWVVPYFREQAITMLRGVPMENILMYYGGDERGHAYKKGWNVLPVCIPVATQLPHATGLAWSFKMQKKKSVVLTFCGDGATSPGDFHEALNFASVYKVPVVFICQNNQYAISVPLSQQTASETIAQKSIAYGMPTIKVDGNDIFAVYKAVKDAVDNARAGNGPFFIECLTYRLTDHTTSDDASKYRSDKELKYWEDREPIKRFKAYIEKNKLWDKNKEEQLLKDAENKVNEAVKKAENVPAPTYEDFFKNTYKELTPELKEEMDYLRKIKQEKNG